MSDLKYWEEKIKEKRKKTEFRSYLKEIASWLSIGFYKNSDVISRYPSSNRVSVNNSRNMYDINSYNIDFDLSKGLFNNFKELSKGVLYSNFLHYTICENCDFSDIAIGAKDCYLSKSVVLDVNNVLYSFFIKQNCLNILNSFLVWNDSTNIYFSVGILSSMNVFYSKFIDNSSNIWFSSNLVGCSECILCDNLENQSYYINNIKLDKQSYFIKKEEILKNKSHFLQYYKNIKSKGKNIGENIINSIFIRNSESVINGIMSIGLKNSRNILFWGGKGHNENMYDVIDGGSIGNNDFYGVCSAGAGSNNIYLSSNITGSSNIYYSFHLDHCSFCIGCIGLKNKSFCILNKQYSKEEWLELADKIFSQMDKDGILGDFFPGSLNPFYFNDTMAYLIDDSFTKEEVEKNGFLWRNENIKVDIPENAEVINSKDLNNFQNFDSNGNWQINPEILKKVIQDENGNIYKIVKMEYDFLVKYGLPLPEIHWLDRIKLGFKF